MLRKNPERAARTFHFQRALRQKALDQVRAEDVWVSVVDILDQIAIQKGLGFNCDARSSLSEGVCLEIEAEIRGKRLVSDDTQGIMLLSNEYSETIVTASELAKILDIGFGTLDERNYRKSLVQFLSDHCWIKRSIAEPWFKARGYTLRRRSFPAQTSVVTTARQETACRRWLIDEMQSNQEPPQRRDAYAAQAKETFGVGTRAFRRAWDAAVFETKRFNWKNAGRPKKSRR
ncbi:MAG TPA: hypothetical protein VKG24_04060 [Pseudolabrys sp.]|nr:hypothetical protein [Pseudolabrys sp.]